MSKCNCFDDVLKKVEDSIKCKNELEVKWQNKMYYLGEGNHIPVSLKIQSEWRQTKVNGQPYRNKTKEEVNVKMKFCPMCGVEWN